MNKFYALLFSIFFSSIIHAQISGVVIDKSGNTIIGAHIHALKTNSYALTDVDGKFNIKATAGEDLEITMIGMVTKKVKATDQAMKIIMEEDMVSLQETVVIGYGSKKKGAVTGSVVQVKSDEITRSPNQSAIQAIQGKAAGVNIVTNDEPGQNPSIRIRGLGTVLGGRDPLYIIDGIEASSLNGLSPNEIESIDILKDAASLAIYGQKGSNGVVVITTKKGKMGNVTVNFNSYAGIKTMQNKVKMADSYRFAYYNNVALGSATYFNFEQPYNTDWLDEITGNGFVNNNYLSIAGGSENINYYLGFTDYREDGILNGTSFSRNNLSSRNEYKLFKNKLKITQSLNIVSSNNTPKPNSAFTNAYKQSPIVPVYFDNGRWGVPIMNKTTGLIDINGDDRFNNVANPVAQLFFTNEEKKEFQVFGSMGAEVEILKNLKFNSNLGAAYSLGKGYNFNATQEIWLSQNPTSSIDDYKNTFGSKDVIYNSLTHYSSNDFKYNWDNFLTFKHNYLKNTFTVVLGTSRSIKNNFEYLSGTRMNVPEQTNYWFLNHSTYNSETAPGSVVSNYHTTPIVSIAYFARVDYEYSNKYLLSGSIRREGVSVFQEDQRWGIFPAISGGWLINREPFMSDIKFINHMKIRAGYGEVGNSNTGNAVNNIVFSSGNNYAFGANQNIFSGSVVPYQVDPNLTWETMKEYDLGIDFILFKNLLSGTIEFYNRTSSNLILPVTLPSVLSPENVYVNTGKVINKGIELSLKFSKQLTDKFNYSIGGNISYNNNELTEVENAFFSNFIGGSLGNGQWTKQVLAGEALGSFYIYDIEGINADGAFIYSDDRIVAGSYLPTYTGGMNLSVNYGNFDFSTYLYGVAGNKIYNGKKAQRFGGENIESAILDDFWLVSNPDATNPKPFNDVPIASTYYLESGAYLRVNNISIGYSIPSFSKHINKFRVYFSAVNPFIFTKYSGFSPEIAGGDNANPMAGAGIELDAYPTNKSFIIGLNVEF